MDRTVYKKIDSTLRGNIGTELRAVMEEVACRKAIVAPAFPAVGRTTTAGILLVNGVPVAETQFASDPISPVKESSIPRLLEQTIQRPVGCITIGAMAAGAESLYRKVSGLPQDILVCDVTRQSHLTCIAQAAALARGSWLLCGSGGLARELHLLLSDIPKTRRLTPPSLLSGPALVVTSTRHQVTARQLNKARDEIGLPILGLEVESLREKEATSAEIKRLVQEAHPLISQGKTVAISSTFSQYKPQLKWSVASIMAEAVARIISLQKPAGLFLSGGDIAVEVCRRLSASAIQVRGEIEPGVPAAELISGQGEGIRAVTKAGGFGTEEALMKSISYLEKGYLP
jgi:uncharacterized protein YgbK (DUF1537 family)